MICCPVVQLTTTSAWPSCQTHEDTTLVCITSQLMHQQSFLAFFRFLCCVLIRHVHGHAAYYIITRMQLHMHILVVTLDMHCLIQLLATQLVQDLHNTTLHQDGQLASLLRVLHDSASLIIDTYLGQFAIDQPQHLCIRISLPTEICSAK